MRCVRNAVATRQKMGEDGSLDELEALRHLEFPEGLAPLDELLAAPDVVDEDVEAPALLGGDSLRERGDLRRVGVVDGDGDAASARGRDQLGRVLDGLGAVHGGARGAGGAAGDVDGGARVAELDGDATAGAARAARDQSYVLVE